MAQSTHATTAVPAQHGPSFPPFETGTFLSQIIWLAIAFGLLYYLMSKVALPQLEGIFAMRTSRLRGDLDEADRLRQEAAAAGAAYESALTEARDRAKGIAQTTREALSTEAEVRRKAVEADMAEKLAAAEATIKARTADAMSNVRDIASDAAAAIVERLTGQAPDMTRVKAAVDRSLQG